MAKKEIVTKELPVKWYSQTSIVVFLVFGGAIAINLPSNNVV